MNLGKYLCTVSLIAVTLLSTEAHAVIPSLAFKNVTQPFKKENKQHLFSPTLGQIALESSLIYNLRFFGPFEAAYTEDGKRAYAKDQGLDPIWNFLAVLFPSTGGHVATDALHPTNFGRHVHDPTVISVLANFAYKVMQGQESDKLAPAVQQELFFKMCPPLIEKVKLDVQAVLEAHQSVIQAARKSRSNGHVPEEKQKLALNKATLVAALTETLGKTLAPLQIDAQRIQAVAEKNIGNFLSNPQTDMAKSRHLTKDR